MKQLPQYGKITCVPKWEQSPIQNERFGAKENENMFTDKCKFIDDAKGEEYAAGNQIT